MLRSILILVLLAFGSNTVLASLTERDIATITDSASSLLSVVTFIAGEFSTLATSSGSCETSAANSALSFCELLCQRFWCKQ